MNEEAEVIDRERVFEGKVFAVERERVKLPHGPTVTMDIVRHTKSAVILPAPEPGHIILIRQYRHAVKRWLWEAPAGSVDDGESPEEAAKRECHEEIGLVPESVTPIGSFFPTPGYCDEERNFFRAEGLRPPKADETARPDEDEDIETRAFSRAALQRMIAAGEIVDLKTVAGLALVT